MKTLLVLVTLSFGALLGTSLQTRSAPVQATGGVLAVELGGAHSCALTSAGGVKCWGWNYYGQLGDGTTASRLTPVNVCASGSGSGCSPLAGVPAIAGGSYHTCALTAAGNVKCWGWNEDGQLGDGTITNRAAPANVCQPSTKTPALSRPNALPSGAAPGPCLPLTGVTTISAGGAHTCAVTTARGVKCWGSNSHGQLGDGTTMGSASPVDVCAPAAPTLSSGSAPRRATPLGLSPPPPACDPISDIAVISAGSAHTCALTTAGSVLCWGNNSSGELGDDQACGTVCTTPTQVCEPQAGPACVPVSDVTEVSSGSAHTCLTAGGFAKCWGDNASGQLGDGAHAARHAPAAVCAGGSGADCAGGSALKEVAMIAAGVAHTCALSAAGGVQCWGSNTVQQLGNGTTTNSSTPIGVAGLGAGVLAIAAGGSHTCALTTLGGITCWGLNGDGRLGDGTFTPRATPVDVVGLEPKDTPTPTPSPVGLRGDVNCDGAVTSIDAAVVLQFVAAVIGAMLCQENADVNADGAVNSIDAALILQVAAGLLPAPPP